MSNQTFIAFDHAGVVRGSKHLVLWAAMLLMTPVLGTAVDMEQLKAEVSVSPGRLAEQLNVEIRPATDQLPPHLRYSFDDDKLSDQINHRERQLLIIPIDAYRAQYNKREMKAFDKRLFGLKQVIYRNIGEYVGQIPIFPVINARQAFHAAIAQLGFDGGGGVRFITRYGKEGSISTNKNIFYTFQGVTRNGKALVCLFYPIAVRNLPLTAEDSTCAMYIDQQTPERFTPHLHDLDKIVQAIQIKQEKKR